MCSWAQGPVCGASGGVVLVLRPLAGGLPGTAGQEASAVGHLCPS